MPTAALPDEEIVEAAPAKATTQLFRGRVVAAAISIAITAAAVIAGAVTSHQTAFSSDPSPAARPTAGPPAPRAPLAPPMRDIIPRIPTVTGVAEVGAIHQQRRIAARDNGQSTRYGDQSIWVFADTTLRSPRSFLSNSGAATTDLNASDGITLTSTDLLGTAGDHPSAILPRTDAERAFEKSHVKLLTCTAGVDEYCNVSFGLWPGPVVADPVRRRVLIFYDKICRGGAPGAPCSERYGKELGTGVAALDMTTHQVTRLVPTNAPAVTSIEGRDPTLFFSSSSKYNSAAVVAGDQVYVYGDCETRCHLARVPLASVADRSEWRFYAGRDDTGAARWSLNPNEAVGTARSGAAGNTVFWNAALDGWLNIFMPYGSRALKAQIGGSPYGPWSRPFTLVHTDRGGWGTNYAAYGHPEYAERDGLVEYLSYYQQSTGGQRLVKVTFSR